MPTADSEVAAEAAMNLMLQNATSSRSHGGRRKSAIAFTEHGALMAASVLNSQRAVDMSIYVVRAFVRMRQELTLHEGLRAELRQLKKSVTSLDAETRRQFDQVYEAILGLMATGPRRSS